eukprot:3675560-Pyramimonas_sp.AAC.1
MTTTTTSREGKERDTPRTRTRTRTNTTGQLPTLAVVRDIDQPCPIGLLTRREVRRLHIRDLRLRRRGGSYSTRSENRQSPGDKVATGEAER